MSAADGPEVRIGDTEREAAVNALGDHYAAGRLTKDEFDERSERAYAAKTRSEMLPLFADLPRPQAARATPRPVQASPGPCSGAGRGRASGAYLVPVLLVLLAVVVFTRIPLFVPLIVGFVLFAKLGGHWGHRSRAGSGPYARR